MYSSILVSIVKSSEHKKCIYKPVQYNNKWCTPWILEVAWVLVSPSSGPHALPGPSKRRVLRISTHVSNLHGGTFARCCVLNAVMFGPSVA